MIAANLCPQTPFVSIHFAELLFMYYLFMFPISCVMFDQSNMLLMLSYMKIIIIAGIVLNINNDDMNWV